MPRTFYFWSKYFKSTVSRDPVPLMRTSFFLKVIVQKRGAGELLKFRLFQDWKEEFHPERGGGGRGGGGERCRPNQEAGWLSAWNQGSTTQPKLGSQAVGRQLRGLEWQTLLVWEGKNQESSHFFILTISLFMLLLLLLLSLFFYYHKS